MDSALNKPGKFEELLHSIETKTGSLDLSHCRDEKKLGDVLSQVDKFELWEELPLEIKFMIIEKVDITARYSLLFCSRSMNQIARQAPVHIRSIDLKLQHDLMRITIETNPDKLFNKLACYFDYIYDWTHLDKDESPNFAGKMLKLAKFEVDELFVTVNRCDCVATAFFDTLKVKKRLRMFVLEYNEPVFTGWLKTANSPLDKLEICFTQPLRLEGIKNPYDHEVVKNARHIAIESFTTHELSDSSLLNFNCEKFFISDTFGITERGINAFLKRWVDDGGSKKFKSLILEQEDIVAEEVLENIAYFDCDDEFRRENKTFIEWFDKNYPCNTEETFCYIESKNGDNGAVLAISSMRCTFCVSGILRSDVKKKITV